MAPLKTPFLIFVAAQSLATAVSNYNLRSSGTPRWTCRLSNGNDVVSVITRGEHRYLSFGADVDDEWQARLRCGNSCDHDGEKHVAPVDSAAKCPPCPCDAPGAVLMDDMYYNAPIFKVLEPLCRAATSNQPVDVLMVGLGGGVLHRHVLERCPNGGARVRSVERDQRVVDLARRYFGLELAQGRSEVQVGDALKLISEARIEDSHVQALGQGASMADGILKGNETTHTMGSRGWNAVVVDCFNDDEIPESCKSTQFLDAVKRILKPGGVLIQHVYNSWEGDPSQAVEFRTIVRNYKQVFANKVTVIPLPKDVSQIESLVVARP